LPSSSINVGFWSVALAVTTLTLCTAADTQGKVFETFFWKTFLWKKLIPAVAALGSPAPKADTHLDCSATRT
jgi:hypothetical protein